MHTNNPRMEIPTYTGKLIDLENLKLSDIDILDIATSLSNQCRFIGHSMQYYSVAEHSILGSDDIVLQGLLESQEEANALALAFLMHDAAEAYVSDLSTPIKAKHPSFIELEGHILALIWERFGLPERVDLEKIKAMDMAMLAMEKKRVMIHDIDWGWELPEPAEITPLFMSPCRAKDLFLERFKELSA